MRRLAWPGVVMLLLAGCAAQHGRYTAEGVRKSEEGMRSMKAAAAYDIAMQRFTSGDLPDALQQVESSLSVMPDVGDAHLLRVRILLEMGRSRQALQAIQRGVRVAPADARFAYYEGVLDERMGRAPDALKCYQQAAEMAPEVLQYRLAAGEMMMSLGQLAAADAWLVEAAEEFPSSPGLLQTRGHIALMQQRPADATKMFAEAYTLAPKEMALCDDLARSLFAQARYGEAIGYLNRLLVDGDHADRMDLQHMAVRCLINSDQPVEARKILRKIIRARNGQAYEAWKQMADVALILDDAELLRKSAARMASLAPKRSDGYLAMALYQARAGDPSSAVATLEYCRKMAGASPLVDHYFTSLKSQLAKARGEASTKD